MPSFDAPSGQSLLLIKLHVLFFFFISFTQHSIFAAWLAALLLRIGKTNSLNTDNFTVLVNTLDLLAHK